MAVNRAASRNDLSTVQDALEVSAEMLKKDANNVSDYVQRHLISIPIWEELRYAIQHAVGSMNFIIFWCCSENRLLTYCEFF